MSKRLLGVACLLLAFFTVGVAQAELQNVEVGGELRIRGRWYINTFQPGGRQARISNNALWGRPLGPTGTASAFKWDSKGTDWTRLESTVLLNVKADFTQNVSAFIEFYDFFIWGEDFRSQNYLTGADTRANSADDIEINQAYIDMKQIGGTPLSLRVGRQELKLGKGWLLSNMMTPSQYLSHDAIRLTYAQSDFTVDAFASRIVPVMQDPFDDVDLYGVYGTYAGFKPLSVSAYYLLLHDPREVNDTQGAPIREWAERLLDVDHYGDTYLNTLGFRLFSPVGGYEGFDYDWEFAYQFGTADSVGAAYRPVGKLFGDGHANFNNIGTEAAVGYTFDVKMKPRPYLSGVFFQGHDNRDISFVDWLNPFSKPHASVSFNRLFSENNYCPTINDNGSISNFWQVALGVDFAPLDKVTVRVQAAYDGVVDPFSPPVTRRIFGKRVPVAPFLSFWTQSGSDELGWELATRIKYQYSPDLYFLLYANYLFVGDGLAHGAYIHNNGTDFSAGSDNHDAAYIFLMSVLKF